MICLNLVSSATIHISPSETEQVIFSPFLAARDRIRT